MNARRAVFCATFVSAACLFAGCIGLEGRTSNQGGGNLLTAGAKVLAGNMSSLTADEIQVLGDEISSRSTRFAGIEISDEQAEAASDFLVANKLNTVAEIQALVNNPGNIQIPESVQALLDAGLAAQ
jgi:hypothetical protein